jgi:protein O-GlcNAc transferase
MAHAWRLRSQSRWREAAEICRFALSSDPACGEAWHLLGLLAHDQHDPGRAVAQLKQAIAVEPRQPLHYNNLGVILNATAQYARAVACLRRALEIRPAYPDALCNLGLALYHQRDLSQAARCFEQALAGDPRHAAALANLGMTRLAQQKYPQAAAAYERAIAIDPLRPQWYANLGAACMRLAQFARAAASFARASQLDPGRLEHFVSQGIALRAAGRLPESIRVLEQALSKNPYLPSAIAHLVVALEYTCQWDKLELFHPMLDQATQRALAENHVPDEDPMQNIRRSSDPGSNQSVSRAWSRNILAKACRCARRFGHKNRARPHARITLGYLSYDFRNHPVAHQLFPLFGMHDRSRFRVVAFSMGPDDGSRYRREIMAGCDEFFDIRNCGLADAAQLIYDQHVDILVDLMGHSHHNRLEILALRPAPLQVGYLGFLSTTGSDFIDYLVTDPVVVSEDQYPFYDEKLLRLPHCYQFNHSRLIDGRTGARRQDWELPAEAFVFCCFNTVYKIDRALFDTWMRILHRTPGAVLWLNGGHSMAADHMRSRAATLGIDPRRLVLAAKVPLEEHLNRLPLADLALDTLHYNGGATTANALAAGVPVITVMGRHWVSRMAASHLFAVGLPELVCRDVGSYERTAVELTGHPEKLRVIRQRLALNRKTQALFRTRDYVRHLEDGFESIWRRYLKGLQPDHIDVPPGPAGVRP